MMKRIAYQGVEGSYSHMTGVRLFGTNAVFLGLSQFSDVVEAVENGAADAALLAIENTLVGPIYEVLDLIGESALQINGETETRIEHCLLTLPAVEISEIRTVYSHPKALGQCLKFFRKHPFLVPESYVDTAAAAAFVAKKNDPATAAIASQLAGSSHGLQVCLANIEDNPENFTRFFLLSKQRTQGPKCTIRITLDHKPGSLVEILSMISKEGVNVTSIVSRPLIGRPFEYAFYLDLETPALSLLEEIERQSKTFRNLGSYERI
jgi:prephenate dehydratase